MKTRNLLPLLAGWLLTAGTSNAQTATSPKQDEAVTLSPFEVRTDKDTGYVATNTLSGSRINTPLYSTPSVTSVFTRDFLNDIAANDLVEAFRYGLNVDGQEQPNQSSNFRANITSDNAVNIRGLTASTARNYFVWSVNGDSYNLERIDFSRGPNNILFGLGGQGGVINSTTKRALTDRDLTTFQLRMGDWDLYRGHLDVNRTLFSKRVALRVNLLSHDEGGWKNHSFYDRRGAHLAGTWKILNTPSASTTVRADYEKLHFDRVLGYRFPLKDGTTRWNGVGIPANGSLTGIDGITLQTTNRRIFSQAAGTFGLSTGLYRTTGFAGTSNTDESIMSREANYYGPDNRNDSDVENGTVVIEQRLFRDLFVEFAFNKQGDHHTYTQVDGYDLWRNPHQFSGGVANPRFRDYYSEYTYIKNDNNGRVYEQRVTASYDRDFGKFGHHQIAALASRRLNISDSKQFSYDDVATNLALLFRRYVSDGDGARFTDFDPSRIAASAAAAGVDVGFRQGALSYSESRQDTRQAVHIGNFFSGRLTTVYGVRRDELFNRTVLNGTRDVITTEPLYKRRREWVNYQLAPWGLTAKDTTRTKGFTLGWSAQSPLRVYYNESESFVNQGGELLVDLIERNRAFPPRTGQGKDMGLRFRLLDDRIQGSIGYFETRDIGAKHALHGFFPNSTSFVAILLGRRNDYVGWQDRVDMASKGHEFEITANLTRNWRLHFNYSRTNLTTSNHGPDAKRVVIGQFLPEWKKWAAGWRQGAGEVLPAGVTNNTAAAVSVAELGRPLTFQEAHGGGIDPGYDLGARAAQPIVTLNNLGLADWISRVNWASDIWFQDGMAPRRHRRDNFNVFSNYAFARATPLKGWAVGAGARWRGPAVLDRVYGANNNIITFLGKPRVDTDMNLSYTHKFQRFTLRTQLNVNNLFNSGTLEVINVAGNADERGHLQFQDPRNLRLTLDFIF